MDKFNLKKFLSEGNLLKKNTPDNQLADRILSDAMKVLADDDYFDPDYPGGDIAANGSPYLQFDTEDQAEQAFNILVDHGIDGVLVGDMINLTKAMNPFIGENTDYDERRKKESDYHQEEENTNDGVYDQLNDMMRDMSGEDLDDFLAFYAPDVDNRDANAITDWVWGLNEDDVEVIINDLQDYAEFGVDVNENKMRISQQAAELVDGYELEDLERNLEQIYRDMEQEAEPEGGPIADQYADEIHTHEEAIRFIKSKGKEQAQKSYDVAVGKITQDEYDTIVSKDQFNKSSKFDRNLGETIKPGETVTKSMWEKMTPKQKQDALETIVKDPDEAAEYVDKKYENLPADVGSMTVQENKKFNLKKYLKEGKLFKNTTKKYKK